MRVIVELYRQLYGFLRNAIWNFGGRFCMSEKGAGG